MKKLIIGPHLSVTQDFQETFENADKIGATGIQIFLKNNRSWQAPSFSPERIEKYFENKNKSKVEMVVAHASYLTNLGSEKEDVKHNSVKSIIADLQTCDALKIPYIVVHPGSNTNRDAGLLQIAAELNKIFDEHKFECMFLIETMAGQGNTLCTTFEEIAVILKNVKHKKNIGVCLDTCHVFAAGYDLSNFDEILEKFSNTIGLENLKVIHLNDSKEAFNSRKDRHANIGTGAIDKEILKKIVHHPKLLNIPKILETPDEEGILVYKKEIDFLTS